MNIIVTVMENLCMKVGTSKEETVECVQRVKERRMGYMFENMEKMNIQEERKKTARAEKKAEQAEKKAEKKARETIIEVIVSICQEKGTSKEEVIDKVMEKCQLNRKTAEKRVDLYWKEIL